VSTRGDPRAVLVALLCLVVACSKAATTESHPSEAPAPAGPTVAADATTTPRDDAGEAVRAPDFGKNNASGAQLGSAVDADLAQRAPAGDLNAQVGGVGRQPSVPSKATSTRITLVGHRALDASSLDSSAVAGRYMGTGQSVVKRCYESVLAQEAHTSGRMTLRFAVTTAGHVADATADSWSPTLSKCVLDLMPAWRFPAPKAQGRFELTLALVAE
jgi:hypothetical protein